MRLWFLTRKKKRGAYCYHKHGKKIYPFHSCKFYCPQPDPAAGWLLVHPLAKLFMQAAEVNSRLARAGLFFVSEAIKQ
jgi:hypothetical protein